MDPFVTPDWLAEHLDEVVICHVGTEMVDADPLDAFTTGHIPGARYVSLDHDLADPPAPAAGRHPLPTAERFASVLASIGIGHDDAVVAYDGRGGGFAARLVWMLRSIGHEAALLREPWPGAIETDPPPTLRRVERRVIDWPREQLADSDAVARHIEQGGIVVDSREAPRYRGEIEPIDTVAGHVPGAINIPFASDDPDRFARLTDHDAHGPAIVYCGSGVTACVNALAIEAAGLMRPRVYIGSWSGWSTEPGRAVATGDQP